MKRTAWLMAASALFLVFPITASATPTQAPSPEPALPIIGGGEIVTAQLVDYIEAVQAADIVALVVADEQAAAEAARVEAERIAAEQAAAAARVQPAPTRSVGSTVGECSGFVIPDYIIQRESGGNPSAYNPSGAYGCAQTLLSHYSGGSCSGLDPYTIDGQRECVNRLSNGGTNLAPWAETR